MNPVHLDDAPPDQTHLTAKHMGCIAGFLHIFDRNPHQHHKPLAVSPPPPVTRPPAPSEKPQPSDPPRPSLPVPLLEPSRSPWKLRDSPRLSLDSRLPPREIRAVRYPSDGSDLDRRSPSVVARLMGLDALPSDLRRCASASASLAAPPPPPSPPPPRPPSDLEALRDVLEALHLKGLRVGDGRREPIVVMRPAPSPPPPPRSRLASDPRPRKDRVARSPRRKPPPPAAAPRTPSGCDVRSDRGFGMQRERMEYQSGRKLLERCDRLLSSIAEITEASATSSERQPSPVSVLDCGAEFAAASPPSPKPKRSLDFEDRTADGRDRRTAPRGQLLVPIDASEATDGDFLYVAKVLAIADRATKAFDENVFYSLEKEHRSEQPSKASRLHRRLVFDAVVEIVEEKKRPLPPWESFARSPAFVASPRAIWSELKRAREHVPSTDNPSESASDALRKDMDGRGGEDVRRWSGCASELSDVVLDIERLVFKDLVADTIRDLASPDLRWRQRAVCRIPPPPSRLRKLVF